MMKMATTGIITFDRAEVARKVPASESINREKMKNHGATYHFIAAAALLWALLAGVVYNVCLADVLFGDQNLMNFRTIIVLTWLATLCATL